MIFLCKGGKEGAGAGMQHSSRQTLWILTETILQKLNVYDNMSGCSHCLLQIYIYTTYGFCPFYDLSFNVFLTKSCKNLVTIGKETLLLTCNKERLLTYMVNVKNLHIPSPKPQMGMVKLTAVMGTTISRKARSANARLMM